MTDAESNSEPVTTMHVRRAIDGDSESLDWIVRRLSPLLVAEASYRLGSGLRRVFDPEDLVHDTWLVALPRLRDLNPRDGRYTPVLLRFLSQTLLRRMCNLVRRHARTGRLEPESTNTDPADARSGVVSRAIHDELESKVLRCIDELEPKDREILVLRGIEQLRNQTVAQLLDLTPQGVTMRYRRALERLRKRLPGSVFDGLED